MVYQLEVKVMGKDWLALGIKDTLDLWTPARWPASTFKLDLIKLNVVFVFRPFLFSVMRHYRTRVSEKVSKTVEPT